MNSNSMEACRIIVGDISLIIDRIGPDAIRVGTGLMQVTFSKEEILELKRDFEQVFAELFPECEDRSDD